MRASLLFLALCGSAPACLAQTITSYAAGSATITVTAAATPAGATSPSLTAYQVGAAGPCTAAGALSTLGTATPAATGDTTINVNPALTEGESLCVIETFTGSDKTATSAIVTVPSLAGDWGRVRAYFVGGILVANDNSSFSSAHQFYDLTVEKHWRNLYAKSCGRYPGITSFFETRLTSIPVASNGANTPAATSSFLTSQQTAVVNAAVYFPFLLSQWDYQNNHNALFIAPLGKIGFNTITGATSQQVTLPGGGTGTQEFQQIYNFREYGARVGHMVLSANKDVAPETYSYLDFTFGQFSNLESLICQPTGTGGVKVSGSGCTLPNESRKRLYRIDIEGLLEIPKTIFYVGLNANIGQKEFEAQNFDPAFQAPDDLRFLFGTKVDIARIFTKLGVKLP